MPSYVAAVIASNPDHYWRLNEGPGAAAALDYGNAPGMLWARYEQTNGIAQYGMSGFGFSGITADGGALQAGPSGLWSTLAGGAGTQNRYVTLPEPGTLEFWSFVEDSSHGLAVEWNAPSAPAGQQGWGLSISDNLWTAALLTSPIAQGVVDTLSQWHHFALSWGANTGFVYLDGTQVAPISYTGPIAGGHVWFLVGDPSPAAGDLNISGLVTEVATYRRALSVGDLDAHFDAAELKGVRPHWKVQTTHSDNPGGGTSFAYSLGVTHLARTGSGSFSVPSGLRGFMIDIIDPKPPGRVSAGQPPYLWDVGWVSLLDSNGILEERRPNRDRTIWLPERAAIATTFTHDLLPGWTIDVTELDPA